jgi:hypothetical protein
VFFLSVGTVAVVVLCCVVSVFCRYLLIFFPVHLLSKLLWGPA